MHEEVLRTFAIVVIHRERRDDTGSSKGVSPFVLPNSNQVIPSHFVAFIAAQVSEQRKHC